MKKNYSKDISRFTFLVAIFISVGFFSFDVFSELQKNEIHHFGQDEIRFEANGSFVKLNQNGIQIHAANKLIINSGTNFNFNAIDTIEIDALIISSKSQTQTDISSTNISADAVDNFILKGGMVRIN